MRPAAAGAALAVLCVACTADAPEPRAEPSRPAPTAPSATPVKIVTEPADGWLDSGCSLPFDQLQRVRRGYNAERSPEVLFVPREPNMFGGFTTTTHSGPWDYVQRVPMVFYGPGFIRPAGEVTLDREPTLADLAPTLAELLGLDLPRSHAGRAIDEVLLPEAERAGKPRMILTVVWDGGGWNVLDNWPDAWPFLRSLMERGASVADVVVGSSPSVTPAIHTTMGTGTFPKQHGIVDIPVRVDGEIVGAYAGRAPQYLLVPSLADLWDRSVGNAALVGMMAYKSWHLGMIGHGSYLDGADKDIAVIAERTQGNLVNNPDYYELPAYLNEVGGFENDVREVDLDDGEIDGAWMGHEVLDDPNALRETPVWVLYQTRVLKTLFTREGFGADDVTDLFFTNYKQVDEVGHSYNMLNPEMEEIIRYSDDALKELVAYLNKNVGKNRWVVVYTADHGQGPDPLAVGAWPIRMSELQRDVAEHFDLGEEVFQDERPVGFWLDEAALTATGVTVEQIADFLVDYRLEDNIPKGEQVPEQYRKRMREPIFSAAFPGDAMGKVYACAKRRA